VTFEPNQSHEKLDINLLIADLSSPHLSTRQMANTKLSSLGNQAIPYLLPLLKFSPSKDTRKEVVKILGKIKGPESIDALIPMLLDENFEVRWDATESLINIGSDSLAPLLEFLEKHYESGPLRRGVRHYLRQLRGSDNSDDPLEKLFHALDGSGPIEEIPWLARNAFDHMNKK
jgi:HEAT repeat protein